MISLKDEIKNFKPLLEIDDIEDSINNDDFKDILDMLSYISKQKNIDDYK
ncbi:MAG: hypothetical protein IAC55_00710 [Tyzzerella sp.]|uniref:Uncharacterized protein n=1 Tax=Candidatus Fimicola merdigallinarum TaxID=2840819 RepID=A0A9D9DVB0_9FIRM|nr:hypothetical protein [Candidatus Fimicola merdigallinarum]